MNDKIYNYTISWTQSYDNWPSQEWIDEAQAVILESKLEQQGLAQAQELIDRIRYDT